MHTRQRVAVPALSQNSAAQNEELSADFLYLTPPVPAEMYAPAYNAAGQLTHSPECGMMFNRTDKRCPRCCQIEAGRAPRGSWHRKYYKQKIAMVQPRLPLAG